MGLLKQRTRWNQGFLQVLAKREWRQIPSWRRRALARYTLCQPFLQAFAGIAIPIAFASVFVAHPPVGLSLLTFLSMATMIAMVVFELVGLREFCRLYHVRPRATDYLRLLIGTGPYQMILAAAACRAVVRELRGHRRWEKTAHNGAHRDKTATGGFSLVRAAT